MRRGGAPRIIDSRLLDDEWKLNAGSDAFSGFGSKEDEEGRQIVSSLDIVSFELENSCGNIFDEEKMDEDLEMVYARAYGRIHNMQRKSYN